MNEGHGNKYKIEQLDNGVVSFRHIQSGEILHGNVGPEHEARTLYLESSGFIINQKKKLTVFDVGTGCAAQLLALLDHMESTTASRELQIFSFDLEKEGIQAVLAARDTFPAAHRHTSFLSKALESDQFLWETHAGRIEWQFIGGDFCQTISDFNQSFEGITADYVFYDFFSPASHPWLWTYDIFSKLIECCNQETRLVTYSSATSVKAALLAAGWYVGTTMASGKKAKSILAAGSLAQVETPLSEKFISTFQASQKPYCTAETEVSRKIIAENVARHPQFSAKTV
jgi:queuine tRNA-ribosyltransferase